MSAESAFEVMADGVRREILAVLAVHGETSSGDIARHVGHVERTTVSSHLRVLRTAGVIQERREGRHRYYSLDREGPTRDALQFLQGLLSSSLGDLKAGVRPAEAGETEAHGKPGRAA